MCLGSDVVVTKLKIQISVTTKNVSNSFKWHFFSKKMVKSLFRRWSDMKWFGNTQYKVLKGIKKWNYTFSTLKLNATNPVLKDTRDIEDRRKPLGSKPKVRTLIGEPLNVGGRDKLTPRMELQRKFLILGKKKKYQKSISAFTQILEKINMWKT